MCADVRCARVFAHLQWRSIAQARAAAVATATADNERARAYYVARASLQSCFRFLPSFNERRTRARISIFFLPHCQRQFARH